MTLPDHLKSTYDLIKKSFPNGVDINHYIPLLKILSDEMSDRNLAEVISHYMDKDYAIVLNDIYRARNEDLDEELSSQVKKFLVDNGYQDWLNEE